MVCYQKNHMTCVVSMTDSRHCQSRSSKHILKFSKMLSWRFQSWHTLLCNKFAKTNHLGKRLWELFSGPCFLLQAVILHEREAFITETLGQQPKADQRSLAAFWSVLITTNTQYRCTGDPAGKLSSGNDERLDQNAKFWQEALRPALLLCEIRTRSKPGQSKTSSSWQLFSLQKDWTFCKRLLSLGCFC